MAKNYWQGKHIKLRALEEKDITRFVNLRNTPDSEADWYHDRIFLPESETTAKKHLEELVAEQKDDKFFFIVENETAPVGTIYVWEARRREGVFRYGIQIEEPHRAKGYAKEALIIILDYYFNELNYQKCAPYAYEFNTRSQAFHEKLGFTKEGILRNETYTRGKYHSIVYYGMLKNEFNSLYNQVAIF